MPKPAFYDNWKSDQYDANVKSGVEALKKFKKVVIIDDGRGYELALDIKRQFIIEYQKQLAEKIKISGNAEIIISLETDKL